MEQRLQHNSFARQGIILLVVFVVLTAAAWFVHPKDAFRLPDLEQYMPRNTVFAFRADRSSVMKGVHPVLAQSKVFTDMKQASQSYWGELERSMGFRIEELLVVISEDRGIEWSAVLFSTQELLKDMNKERYANFETQSIGQFKTLDTLHFQKIADHVGALISKNDTQDYTTPSDTAAALLLPSPIALYAQTSFIDRVSNDQMIQEVIAPIDSLITSEPALRLGFSSRESFFRIALVTDVAPEPTFIELRVPEQYDAVLSGDVSEMLSDTVSTTNPFVAAMHDFINSVSSTRSVAPADMIERLRSVRGFVRSGDRWLLLGEDTSVILDLVTLFIGAEAPKRSISKLPDGSPYREIVRGLPQSMIESWDTINVTLWSRATSSTSTTPATSVFDKLYSSEMNGIWYLSNSKELLSSQFSPDLSGLLSRNPGLMSCIEDAGGTFAQAGIVLRAGMSSVVTKYMFASVKTAENSGLFLFCAQ